MGWVGRLISILSTTKKFWFRNVPHHFQIGLLLAVESLTTFTSCWVFIVPLRKLYILNFQVLFCITAAAKCSFIFQWVKQWKLGGQLFVLFEYWLSQSRLVAPYGNFFRDRVQLSFPFAIPYWLFRCWHTFPVICENRKPFPVLTKSLSCAWSNFCGRHLSHLRLASCRLVLPLKVSCYQVKMDHGAYDFFSNSVIFHP